MNTEDRHMHAAAESAAWDDAQQVGHKASIADELQFILDWEADKIGAVSVVIFKAQIARVRDLEFEQAKEKR